MKTCRKREGQGEDKVLAALYVIRIGISYTSKVQYMEYCLVPGKEFTRYSVRKLTCT